MENKIFPNCKIPKFKVATRCITFNHAKYITDALRGFVIQKTSFPFITIIIDDASSEGEQNVIEGFMRKEFCLKDNLESDCWEHDYSRFIYARHPSNRECYFVAILLKRNLYKEPEKKKSLYYPWANLAEFNAECEGDDFWTNQQKLQKQYDALKAHPECTISFGVTECISADRSLLISHIPRTISNIKKIVSLEDFCREQFSVGQWTFHTSTFFFRKEVLNKYSDLMTDTFKEFPYSDICIVLTGLLMGDGVFLNEKMSKYRVLSGGFNSMMKANPQMDISMEEKLIKGMQAFDKYTNLKYHKHIENRLLRSHCLIDYRKEGNNGLVFLRPRYWKVAKMQGIKTTFLMAVQTLLPGPYYFLRKLLKGR
jgi:hypothetical protein